MMENGGDLNMCINGYISVKNPLVELIKNPYAFGILKRGVDFDVELIESNTERNYILFKRKFDSTIGYVLVFCLNTVTEEKLHKLYGIYKKYCGKHSNYNFREFDLIIITGDIKRDACEAIKEYNEKYVHRRPIKVIINETETEEE